MTDTLMLEALGAAGLGLAALGGFVFARLRSWRRSAGNRASLRGLALPAGGEEAPLTRYQPMFRLLTGEDAEFVRRNRGCPKVAQRWERSQRRVVRLYLKELAADFESLHRQARALAAHSPEQYRYLMPLLFKQQLAFWRALIWIDILVSLHGGVSRISAEALVAAFETLRREVAQGALPRHTSQPA